MSWRIDQFLYEVVAAGLRREPFDRLKALSSIEGLSRTLQPAMKIPSLMTQPKG